MCPKLYLNGENLSWLQWHHYGQRYFQSWDDDTYWISQSQNLKSIKRHLKVARIAVGGTKMSKSAVYLVKFLLRYETTLQELTVTLKSDPSDPPLVRETIRSQIMKFAQPSSNVIISFLPQGQSPQKQRIFTRTCFANSSYMMLLLLCCFVFN